MLTRAAADISRSDVSWTGPTSPRPSRSRRCLTRYRIRSSLAREIVRRIEASEARAAAKAALECSSTDEVRALVIDFLTDLVGSVSRRAQRAIDAGLRLALSLG